MARARLLCLALLAFLASLPGASPEPFAVTDAEYYRMPALFALDDYASCLATGGVYCLGSFELQPSTGQQLFSVMQRLSENWVENFNHTRLHRGVCLPRSCRAAVAADIAEPQVWFASCVNESTTADYGLSARLYHLDYCQRGDAGGSAASSGAETPLTGNERAFTAVAAALLALAAVSTSLDLLLSDRAKKGYAWALSWSVRGSWATLSAPAGGRASPGVAALQPLDGLRVVCMLCVIVEHVCWVTTLAYLADTRVYEKMRWSVAGMLLANSTLVVQIFFLMSSFLLAHKLLSPRQAARKQTVLATCREVMLNRIVRISPSYFFVVWYASSVWQRAGAASGPLAATLVDDEAAVCRGKWWTHLLYVNNLVYPDEKCLIQTWYLAADMQLYAVSLLLTVSLGAMGAGGAAGGAASGAAGGAASDAAGAARCWRAVRVLAALLAASVAAVFAGAYYLQLVPTFVLHNAEAVRSMYAGEASFNLIYQSPLGNLPGALAGLLLAHAHRALLAGSGEREGGSAPKDRRPFAGLLHAHAHLLLLTGQPAAAADGGKRLAFRRWFRWLAVAGAPLAVLWAATCPRLLTLGSGGAAGGAGAGRLVAAALAALERPVFASLVGVALLGAMHGVEMPWRRWLGWRGWALAARLSFGALLLHLPLNKLLVAARPTASHLDASTAVFEWCGVAVLSYLLALPLALLVELPAQRLQRALCAPPAPPPPPPPRDEPAEKNQL